MGRTRSESEPGADMPEYSLRPVGFVRSPLRNLGDAPKLGSEGAPDAWLEISPDVSDGLQGLSAGDEVIVLTWLHQADREVLQVHPRGDPARQLTGVFATRSPDRPNPVGLHRVTVRHVNKNWVMVGPIEAINGTPVIDLKPVLSNAHEY